MSGRFDRLPIHRKLAVTALLVTATAVVLAMAGLAVVDVWRFRRTATAESEELARMLAANLRAAITFDEPGSVQQVLATARVRPVVRHACAYLPDGLLYAGYARDPDSACPARRADALVARGAIVVVADVPDNADDRRVVGTVVLVRDLSDLRARAIITALTGLVLLGLTSAVGLVLASRLQRSITGPIADLARAARLLGRDEPPQLVPLPAAHDELGDLAAAFNAMVARVQLANRTLTASNEALRSEVEQRTRMQAEREQLLEREQRASRLKDEFLATVSHELRTPLNAILGWAQILTASPPSPPMLVRGLESIGRNARAQARVVEDLIDISRIVTGKLRLQMDLVDARAVVDAAVDVVRPTARTRAVTLVVEVPRERCDVDGDAARLQQIVWNLLTNAAKFTPAGGTVTVSVQRVDGQVVISVADTGAGITPQFLPFVFERFRQADGSLTREQGGLGLGLAIVKELTELHGGTVSAHSDGPGTGSTFTVRLPAATGPRAASPAGDAEPLPSLHGVRVLAVDDNLDALDLMVESLTAAGATVAVAQSGEDALRQWATAPADVLLCDLAMPHMSGFDVLQRIRAVDAAAGRFTPALAISAHASEDQQARSLRAGFLQHVSKPYRPSDLVRLVADAVTRI